MDWWNGMDVEVDGTMTFSTMSAVCLSAVSCDSCILSEPFKCGRWLHVKSNAHLRKSTSDADRFCSQFIAGCGEDRATVNRSLVVFGVLYLLIIGELSVWLSLIHTFTLSFDLLGELPLLSGL